MTLLGLTLRRPRLLRPFANTMQRREALKLVLSKQLVELLCEPFLMLLSLIVVSLVSSGSFQLEDALRFSISLWVTALIYRMMMLQLPLAVALKFFISVRWRLSAGSAALINFVSLLGAFLVFDFVFGGAEAFFERGSFPIPFSIFVASTGAPFLVNLGRKQQAY